MNTEPHNHNCTHHRTTILYTPQQYTSIRIYTTQVKRDAYTQLHHPNRGFHPIQTIMQLPRSLRDYVHQSITVTQLQTWTHVPKEAKQVPAAGEHTKGRPNAGLGSITLLFIQVHTSPSNIEPYSYLLTTTTYFTYICTKSCPHSHITYRPQLLPTDMPHALMSAQTIIGQTSSIVG